MCTGQEKQKTENQTDSDTLVSQEDTLERMETCVCFCMLCHV